MSIPFICLFNFPFDIILHLLEQLLVVYLMWISILLYFNLETGTPMPPSRLQMYSSMAILMRQY